MILQELPVSFVELCNIKPLQEWQNSEVAGKLTKKQKTVNREDVRKFDSSKPLILVITIMVTAIRVSGSVLET